MSDSEFKDQTVFVAGGSSGINLGIARAFAQAGAKVAIASRSQERVDGAVAELNTYGAPVLGFYDPRLVRLCLESALDNAMRFATSRVELGAQQQGEYLVFTVDDDGPGPLAEPTQAPTSTGLGLRLCTLVAQAHERDGRSGSARLLTRPSGGARFELRLP